MNIVFIGAGNLATRLAIELYRHGNEIVQVYSRTIESAKLLADKVHSKATNDLSTIDTDADLYIFSVKDSVLPSILKSIPSNDGIWIHTAGSIPLDIFKNHNSKYGVVYPFQTFSKDRDIDFKQIPLFLEAVDTETLGVLRLLFETISDKLFDLTSEKRRYLHLTGVFACNFVNHMYAISAGLLDEAGIPFETVLPLIDETAMKVHEMSPRQAQTGPAVRFDENVMNKHLSMIDDEQRKLIYQLISEDIFKTNKNL